jgi:hypothetical protein
MDRRDGGGAPGNPGFVRLWLYTSDCGSDQVAFRKVLRVETQDAENIMIDVNCGFHQYQIIVKGGLQLIDDWLATHRQDFRYFGALAMLLHVWRDLVGLVFTTACTIFGAAVALVWFKSLPPKCVSGRWGSIDSAEKRVAGANAGALERVRRVLERIFEAGHADVLLDKTEGRIVADAIDEPRIEAQTAYRIRQGKWRRASLNVVSLVVANATSRPRNPRGPSPAPTSPPRL